MIKRLVTNFSLYSFAEMLTKGLGFILLPLYTRLLVPADYGILAIVGAIASVLLPLVTLGTRGAIYRFFFQFDDNNKRREFYGALWLFLLLVPLFFLASFEIIGGVLYKGTFFGIKYHPYISLALWTSYLSLATFTFSNLILKASERVLLSTTLTLSKFLVSTFFTIIIVFFWIRNAKGVLLGRACGTALIGIVSCFFILRYVKLNFSVSHWRSALIYSAPLTIHFIARTILDVSDRFILQRYTTLSEVGIYNVAYQIGSVIALFAGGAYIAILPLFGQAGSKVDCSDTKHLGQVSTYYIFVVSIFTLLVIILSPGIVAIMLAPAYSQAKEIIPWVGLGFASLSLYFLPSATLTHIIGQTKWIAIGTVITGALNVFLNLYFIPLGGAKAAAITTFVCYLILLLFTFAIAQKKYPFPYDFASILKIFVCVLSIYFICSLIHIQKMWIEMSLKAFISVAFAVACVYVIQLPYRNKKKSPKKDITK